MLGALSGAAFVLLVFIGNGLSTDLGSGGEASNSHGEQVMADLGNAAAQHHGFGVLLFPDGRLPSLRWWPVGALATGGVALPG